jgi:hypothetical protein
MRAYKYGFPRIVFAENSSQCIKTGMVEGYARHCSLPMSIYGRVLPS